MTKKILLLLTVVVLAVTTAQAHVSLERVLEKQNAEAAQKHAQRQAEIPAASAAAEEEPQTAVCPECGREVPVGTRCSNHHKPILITANENTQEETEEPSTWTCPECGRELSVNEKTCYHGHKPIAFCESYIKKELPAKLQYNPVQNKNHYVAKTLVTSRGPRCPECGRTPEEVKIHGHNHK